jgi:trk system potassium uptake protein TrkH
MIEKLRQLTYAKLIALGYIIVILAGTILLLLPFSSKDGHCAGMVTALFTATSATCVTGLVIIDTYTQWSLFGQIVILALIQIGGLGFMTIIAIFSLSLKKKIGLHTRSLLRESVNTMYIGGIVRLFKKIIIGTAIFEGLGTLLLYISFAPVFGWIKGFYYALFHAISAFCNAGFDIMGCFGAYASLTPFATNALVCLTVAVLIVIGGIGFFVWDDISKHKFDFKKYELHTKIVLCMTAFLILFGTILIYIFECNNTLSGMTVPQKIIASLFSAITPRTAGFNVLDTGALTSAGKLLTMLLMFIGGSPGQRPAASKRQPSPYYIISLLAGLKNRKGIISSDAGWRTAP